MLEGVTGTWQEYEIILPNSVNVFTDYFNHEGFSFVIKAYDGSKWLFRIIEAHQAHIKFMGKCYDLMIPNEYLMLKNAVETEIAVAAL